MANKTGLARAPQRPGIQGIASNLDDLKLSTGQRWTAAVGDALMDGLLVRTIGGASSLKLEIQDSKAKLLNSPLLTERYDVELDGLPFRFVKASSQGQAAPLELLHEARAVALLRALRGPHKALRQKITRAEFAKRLAMESRPRPRFICPQLHKVQPIQNFKDSEEGKQEAKEHRGKGIANAELTVKGSRADHNQIDLVDRALRVAESLSASTRVMLALVCALIVESECTNLAGGDGTSIGCLQIIDTIARAAHIDPHSVEQSVNGFLTGYGGAPGAIKLNKENPEWAPGRLAQEVQQSAFPEAYETYKDEARNFVEAYGGGSISTKEFTPYAFEQKKNESNWACMVRLAKEVRWRCFESAGWIYYIDDTDLLHSIMRMTISDSTPGVQDTAFDYDIGKETSEMRVEARAKEWAAPPGSVAQVKRHGPADGLWLVHRIEAPLRKRDSLCQITLRRPMEPLPEPTPKKVSLTVGGGEGPPGASKDVAKAIAKMVAEIEATTGTFHYKWGGGHESAAAIRNRLKGWDCSGYISHILYVGGLLDEPKTSGELAGMYESGAGEWLTIYANVTHVFGKIWTPDHPTGRWFQSGGGDNSTGWVGKGGPDSTSGYSARHPHGF